MMLFFRNMMQLMLSPSQGWDDVAASETDPGRLVRGGLIPAFFIASLSIFAQVLFHIHIDIVDLLVGACVIFVSYFVTMAVASRVFCIKVRKWNPDVEQERCQTVVAYALGLMALTTTICNFMPITLGLGYLLPLAITLVVWKAMPYLSIPEKKEYDFLVFEFVVITLPPILIQALYSWVLQ